MAGSNRLVLPFLLLVGSFIDLSLAQSPTVQVTQSSYTVNTGGQVTLFCTVNSNSALSSVFWQKNVNGFVTTITSATNPNKYSGSTTGTPSLTISNSDSSDNGIYTCFAANAFGTGQSTTTTLTVQSTASIPIVQITQSSYSVSSGSSVTLQCTVSSTSTVTNVYWQRNINNAFTTITSNTNTNKYSGSTTNTPSLTIFNAGSGDVGQYTCFATNFAGTGQSSTTSLSVTTNTVPSVSVNQNSYQVNSGSSVTLVCTVSSNLAVNQVYWQRSDGETITTINSGTNTGKYSGSTTGTPSLTIFNAAQSDVGTYTCFATNSVGTGQSTPTTLSVVTTQTVPTVTINQNSYTVNSGSSVTIGCSVSSNLAINQVYWQRNVGGTIFTINSNTNTNKYSGSTTGTPSLTIFNAASSDVGTYTCFATNSAGTGQSPTTSTLNVITQNTPNVQVPVDAYNVVEGNSVTLVCTVTSSLTITSVRWTRDSLGAITPITSTTNTNKYSGSTPGTPSLTITNAGLVDAGDYICYATNSAGEGQSSATTLTVLAQSVPTVTVQQPAYSVSTGGSVTLVCTVTSNQGVNSVYWQRNVGGSITTINSNTNTNKYSGSTTGTPSLTIFNAAQSDVGTYQCFATNGAGTGQSTTTTLSVTGTVPIVQVQQPLYSVTTGSSVTLVCTVSSNLPVSQVYWQRIVGDLPTTINSGTNTNKYSGSTTNTPSLTIFNADQSDVGTYQCFATNSVGTGQSTTTTLSVTGTIPTVAVQQPSYSVTTGNSVTLVCTVSSNLPVNQVYWQRNIGGSITTINSGTNTNKYSGSTTNTPSLTISNTAQSDAGTYTCFATNSVGTGQSTTTTLSVTGTIPTVTVQQPSYSVNTGSSVTLVCTVSSNLPVTQVYWQRNIGGSITTINSGTNTGKYSGSTTNTPSLTIFNAAQSDVGTYTCFATNSVGTGQSTTTTLSVTGSIPTVQILQPTYSVTIGDSITLECTVTSNLPVTSVQWERNVGGTVTSITSTTNTNKYSGSIAATPSLTISNAAQADAGIYTCFATNSVGTGQSTTLTLSVTGSPPTVQVQQPSYSVTTGNSVTLVCTVSSNLPVTQVYWQRNIGGSITTINSGTNTNKYSGSTTTTPSLTIFNAASSDAGTYTCLASNSAGTGQSTTTTLSVTGNPPIVNVQQSSYSVTTGNSVTLVCSVSSNLPVTQVYWQRNIGGEVFTTIDSNTNTNKYSGSTTSTPSLTIFNAAQSDAGTYQCYASNSVGTGQSTLTTLSVTGNPPTVQVLQPTYSVTIGDSITLECTVTSNLPVTSVQWERNIGGPVTSITSTTNTNKYSGSIPATPSLTISNADQADAGIYTCFATNSVGTGQSTTTTLSVTGNPPTVTVQQPSYSVTTGNSVTLVCSVSSNLPVTQVYWQRNIGGSITTINSGTNTNKYSGSTTSTPSLTIFNAASSDAGTYTCFATNSVGTGQSTTTTLSVSGNPPTVTVQQPSYSVTTGNPVTLVCTVSSNLPVTQVYWQRNIGGSITTINSGTNTNKYSGSTTNTPSLTIFNSAQSDVGIYTCFATNSVGTGQSTTTTLSVTENPPTVQVLQPTYSVTIGDSITLECTVTSNLPVTSVQWERNEGGTVTSITSTTNTNKYSGSIPSTPSLTISNAAQADAGIYTCFATNSVGTGQSTTTTLGVTGNPPTVTVQQPSYSVTTGNSVTLVCSVSSNLPVTQVYWQRNIGGSITTINSGTNTNKYSGSTTSTPSLTIFNAASSDVGIYTCFATNSVGTGQSTTTTLSVTGNPPTVTVQQPSYSVTTGNSVTLVCTVSSNLPVTQVYWQRNIGGSITTINSGTNTNKYSGSTTSTPSLTISNTAQSDAGIYTCFATNSVGTGQSTTTTLGVTENPPTVQVLQPSYSVTIGDSITLECTVTSNLPVTSVQWERNVGGTVTSITSTTNTNKYSGSIPATPFLTISNAVQVDAGTYTCFATNSVGTGQSTTTTLSVTGNPPTVQVLQPSYSVTIGDSITLECTVTSNLPVTSVQWERNVGGTVTSITSTTNTNKYSGSIPATPSLTISNAAQADAGIYTCFATNSVGTGQSTTTTLSVTGNPPTVTVQQPTYSVTTGSTVTLVCSVSSNLPVTQVYWQRNIGGSITTINSGTNTNKYSGSTTNTPSLTIFNAASSDAGTYTCFATNSVGTGQSTTTTLSVTGTPPIVTVQLPSYSVNFGGTVSLICSVTSNLPVTNVFWQRNIGGVITTISTNTNTGKYSASTSSIPSLTIFNAQSSDAGTYTCFASNSVGTGQSSTTQLNVIGSIPVVNVLQPTYSALIGSTVTLECTVSATPFQTSVVWQRIINGVTSNINTGQFRYSGSTVNTPSLTISNVDQSDTGNYVCTATNSVGTGTSSQTALTVTGSIPVVTIQQPSYSVTLGGTVTLQCTVSANPTHTSVQWQRVQNGVTTSISIASSKYSGSTVNSPSLSINNADLNDIAEYICTATNIVGTGQSSRTTLTVTGNPPTVVVQQPSYSVLLGNTITLVCTVTSNPAHTSVSWQRTSNGVTTTINVANSNNKYSGSTVNVPSLTIFSSAESDEGSYTCSAVNQFGTGTSTTTTLTVTGSIPTVQVLQSTYNVNFGQAVTLECVVTSNPTHTSVQWQKLVNNQFQSITFANNKYGGSTVNTPSLTVNSADLNDEAFYICTATNSLGTGQSSQTFLDVIGNLLTVTIQQPQYSVLIGSSVTLGCTVSGSPSATTVYWQKTVNNVVTTISTANTNKYSGSTVNTPSLTITGADLNDEANYVCFATNAVGTAQSSQTFLDVTGNIPSVQVLQPQYSVNFGSSVTLECTVTANPTHTSVAWQRIVNGQVTSINFAANKYSGSTVNTPSLTINNADLNDEGNYICTATNSIGTGQSTQTFLDVVGNVLTVQIVQTSYSVLLGNTRTLECLVSGSPAATQVYWQKIQNGVTTTINSNTNTNKYTGSTVNTPSLTVSNAEQSDEANYICFATNAVGTGQSQQTFLDVTGNVPSVVIQQPQYSVQVGNSVTLVCTVTANPAHTTVYWRRIINNVQQDIIVNNNNRYSGSTVNTPSLTINNAENGDEGNYICFATNSVGTGQSAQTFLDVFGSVPVVTIALSSYSVNLGNTVTLGCTVTANPTENNVYWQKIQNGVTTTINSNTNTNKYGGSTVQNPSLQIFNAAQSDEATYVCFATNSVGTGQSQQTVLNVIGSIPVVQVLQSQYSVNFGASRTLECTVTATPTHTSVQWRRTINGVQTTISVTNNNKYSGSTVNNPSLTINNADSSDEGFYTCYATNSVGTGNSQQTYLDVVGTIPSVQVLSNSYTVTLGNPITLECVVTATPTHTSVQWQRVVNGQTTNINLGTGNNKYSGSTVNTPSLTISTTTNSDEGYYTCTATNIAGTGSSQQTYLDVVGSIPSVVVTLPNYNSNIGATVTLDCVVTANPAHTNVYWQRIDTNGQGTTVNMNSGRYSGSTVNNPSLTISNTVLTDEGNYRCYATNSIGTGQSQNTFLDITGNIPLVQVLSNQYSVNIGNSRTLECTVTASPTHTSVYWERNINGVSNRITMNTGKYTGSTVNTPSLTVLNADNTDEGYYTCFATNSVGTGQSSQTYLNVIGSIPIVNIPQPSYSVNFGATVTLTCTVTANPTHTTVYWQKVVNGVSTTLTIGNNKYSGSTVNTPSLTITNADQNDEGFYVCYATNSVGTGNSQQTFLDVAGNLPLVQVLSNTYSVNIANSVTLECRVTANPTHTSVTWLRVLNGVTSSINLGNNLNKYSGSTVNTPSLTINSAALSDEGYYICQATNSVGTGQSSQTYLDVVGSILSVVVAQPQYSVNYGNSVTLVCSVSGTPSATSVYWQKVRNGQTSTINSNTNTNKYSGSTVQNPSLTINNADDSDGASYTCFATNSIGTGQSQATILSITGNLPTATVLSNTYSVTVGGSVTLQCTVSGNPAVTSVQWSRTVNGQTQIIGITGSNRYNGGTVNSPSLVISNAVNADEGFYTCSATNIVGTGNSQQTFLDITGSIPIVNIPQNQYSVTIGNSITLTCTVTANPTHTSVKWVKVLNNVNTDIDITNNNKYSGSTVNTPSLTISSAQSADGGYYVCYATNSIGTGQSQSTFLNVVGNAPQVNVLSNTYSVNVGSSVTLQCTVSANPVHTTVYWKKIVNGVATDVNMNANNNKYSGSTVNSPSLVIANAEIADEGPYVCYADNSIGTGQSSQTYLDVVGNVPIVNVLQLSYSTNIGSSVQLECTVTANPAHTNVYWERTINGQTTQITANTNTNKYSGSTVNTPTLTINNVALSDTGSYRCLADNSIGTGRSQITVLNVAGNVPNVVLDKNSYTVGYGDPITIGCTVTSNPAHTSVYWQRISSGVTQTITVLNNNKYSGSTIQTPSLTIFNADANDEGDYICFATNSVGTGQSSRGNLDVTGSIPTVRVLKPQYNVQRGNPVTLECEVTGSPAHTSVYWTRVTNGQTVTLSMTGVKYGGSSVNSPSLIIFNAEDSDEGPYVCHATNGIGTGQSSQTYLNVEGYVPSVTASIVPSVTVGNSVVINCVVTSDPKETAIVWQKVINSVPTALSITSNSRYSGGTVATPSLTIANVEDSDEGSYICQATNSVGTGSSNQVYLDVVGEAPRLTYITPSRLVVTEGDLIFATCITTANPTATFTWYKDNSNQVFKTGDKLEITTSSRNDMGTYTCRASNSYGVDSVTLSVDVQYKPDVTISKTTSTFSGVGKNSVNIPCSYVANPAVTGVAWRKITPSGTTALTINGNKYAGGGLYQSGLTIYDLASSDAAQYQCVATNPIGTGESEIVRLTVDTQSAPYEIAITPVQVDINVGNGFEATCTAKGDPSPTFTWYFADKMIATGAKLTIQNSVATDDGLYTCVATNTLGMQQATMDANIRYAPISTVAQAEFKRVIGDPVTLKCSTRANPSATEWTWTKDGTNLLNHFSDTYLVDMDSLQDLGTYTCIAKNTVGQSSIIEFTVKQGTAAPVYEVVSVSKLTAGEIAAIVVGILFAIAITAIIIICCFTNGWCRKKERVIEEAPSTKVRDPIYLKDVNFQMVPQYKSVEYIQQEPQFLQPRVLTQQSQYLPAIEYLSDYDEERRRKRKKKSRKPEQVVLEERIVGGGDIYQTTNGMNTSLYRDGGSIYRTVERPEAGDVYIDTVTQ